MADLIERFIQGEEGETCEEELSLDSMETQSKGDNRPAAELKSYTGFKAQLENLSHSTKQNMEDYERLVANFQQQLQAFICFYEEKTKGRFESAMKRTEAILSQIDQELEELKSAEAHAHAKFVGLGHALLGEGIQEKLNDGQTITHFQTFSQRIEAELAALAKSQADFQDLVQNAKQQITAFTSFYVSNVNVLVENSCRKTMNYLDDAENEALKLKKAEMEVNFRLERLKSALQSSA